MKYTIKMVGNITTFLCYSFSPKLVYHSGVNLNYRIVSIFSAFITVLSVTLNSLVIFAMISTRRYKKPADVLPLMLSITDLLAGLTVTPLFAIEMYMLSYGQKVCQLPLFLAVFGYSLLGMSVATINVNAVELYLAIVRPFVYEGRFNQRYYLKILLILWSLYIMPTFLIAQLTKKHWKIYKLVVSVINLLIYICVCISHFYVHRELKAIAVKTSPLKNKHSGGKSQNNQNLFRMTSSVLLAFGVCAFPNFVMNVYNMIWGTTALMEGYYSTWCDAITTCTIVFDPLIYCYRLKTIRERIIKIFRSVKVESEVTKEC